MSGIVGSRFNIRGSGLVGSLGTDGQVFTSSGAGASAAFEAAAGGANTPAFAATIGVSQGIAADSLTKAAFTNEIFDTDGTFDSTTNYRFTPASAGTYMIGLRLRFNTTGNDSTPKFLIYKNGSSVIDVTYRNEGVAHSTQLVCTQIDDGDDYWEVYAYQNIGGTINLNGEVSNEFWGFKIIE